MHRALGLSAVLWLAAAAPGAVRFFFTSSADPAGLTDLTHVFDDTAGNGTDFTDYALNGEKPAVGVPTIDPTKAEFLYLWIKFEDEPNDARIQGINLSADDQPAYELDRGIYIGDDTNGSGEYRWEPSSQTFDPIVLVAFTKVGITNRAGDDWLYYGGTDRVALLGAVEFAAGDYEVRIGLERGGVSYEKKASPIVKLGAGDEEFDGQIGYYTRWSSEPCAVVIPEPAGAALLVLLALRRRS